MKLPSWWLKRRAVSWLLWPISLLFGLVVIIRQLCYQIGIFKTYKSHLPIIVVGNLSVGGTGKTPLVIALVKELKKQGYRPAIITRGYKSQSKKLPLLITSITPVYLAGDEPLLIARQTHCPVVVDPNRTRSVKFLEASGQCDIIIADDGLQHYALHRDLEILVIDSQRQFGNGFLLPAGMLREPVSRIKSVSMVVCNGEAAWLDSWSEKPSFSMMFSIKSLSPVASAIPPIQLTQFKHKKVHAIAGIGNPEQFFALLRSYEMEVVAHPFPDHHPFTKHDFDFLIDQNLPVIMTEKDAVKCGKLLDDAWYVDIEAILPVEFYEEVVEKIKHI